MRQNLPSKSMEFSWNQDMFDPKSDDLQEFDLSYGPDTSYKMVDPNNLDTLMELNLGQSQVLDWSQLLEESFYDVVPSMSFVGYSDNGLINEITSREDEITMKSVHGRSKTASLDLEVIKKYFDVPISRAAKEMNVGVTVLKKRCRELNIMRWPHRKIKSLKSLINTVKKLGLQREIMLLEEHKRQVEMIPDTELSDRTKKLRQACFKACYKRRKSGHESDISMVNL